MSRVEVGFVAGRALAAGQYMRSRDGSFGQSMASLPSRATPQEIAGV